MSQSAMRHRPTRPRPSPRSFKSKGVRASAFKADQADTKQVEDLVADGRQGVRPHRHPRQQCRRVRGRGHRRSKRRQGRAPRIVRRECRRRESPPSARRSPSWAMADASSPSARSREMKSPWAGGRRLLGDQGRGRRLYARLGAGSRPQGHHRQQRAAGTDRHRHGSEGRPARGAVENWNGARPLRQARGGRRGGGVPGKPRSRLHHRHFAQRGWRLQRIAGWSKKVRGEASPRFVSNFSNW